MAAGDSDYYGEADAQKVLDAEWKHIFESWTERLKTRERLKDDPPQKKIDAFSEPERKNSRGLALSGGGIRSAAFAIGALQALHQAHLLTKIHYMSTVSGGGFAGTALTWFFSQDSGNGDRYNTGPNFPFTNVRSDPTRKTMLEYLRFRSTYLEPGVGLNKIALVSTVLRSMFLSIAAYFLLLTAILWFARRWLIEIPQWKDVSPVLGLLPFDMRGPWKYVFECWKMRPATAIALALSVVIATGYLLTQWRSAIGNNPLNEFRIRRRSEQISGFLCGLALAFFGLAILDPVLGFLRDNIRPITFSADGLKAAASWVSLATPILGLIGGFVSTVMYSDVGASDVRAKPAVVLWSSALVLIASFSILSYAAVYWLQDRVPSPTNLGGTAWWLTGGALTFAALAIGWLGNVNLTGLHRFYRDRLMEAFLPTEPNTNEPITAKDSHAWLADGFGLHEACRRGHAGPYHLINANVVLADSADDMYRGRGGDGFILAPLYSGSDATGWRLTSEWIKFDRAKAGFLGKLLYPVIEPMRRMTLATAMSISGAALNPRTGTNGRGFTRSGLLSFVMSLLNLRLGYWAPNPKAEAGKTKRTLKPWTAWYPPNFIHPGILHGLFAYGHDEDSRWIELTDGGHFDNIGLYELVRRRVPNIIVIDGTTDPSISLSSFSNSYERARNDFDVTIDIMNYPMNFNDMMPGSARPSTMVKKKYRLAERGFAIGTIEYPAANGHKKQTGYLFYVNTVLTERLPANLYSYRAEHKDFPDEPLEDQYFDEQQFEAYRELGFEIVWDMLKYACRNRKLSKALGLKPDQAEAELTRDAKPRGLDSKDLYAAFKQGYPKSRLFGIDRYDRIKERLDVSPARSSKKNADKRKPARHG
jgi:hypothetical protein